LALKLELIKRDIRDLMSQFVTDIKAQTALGLSDLNRLSEGFLLELFREVYLLPGLKNLNKDKANFPGLDLGDDATGRAFQITATPSLDKVKLTLQTVVDANLYDRFPSVTIYVITERQSTYSQIGLDEVVQGKFSFDAAKDILDYRDLLKECETLELDHLERVLHVLKKHLANAPVEMGSGVLLPAALTERTEAVELNLVPIWIPAKLFVAEYLGLTEREPNPGSKRRRRSANQRDAVAKEIMARGRDVPEDFEIFDRQIVTFQNLTEPIPTLQPYFDRGTVTDLDPGDFYTIDQDHQHIFQSLLRRNLQRQLKVERVLWQHKLHLFFYGFVGNEQAREISWVGEKASKRIVCSRTMKEEKPGEILSCKHLAFRVAFHLIEERWHLSVMPTWYFSRDGYHVDGYGADRISWLKRQENDQQVRTHFQFILHRLKFLQEESLFDRAGRTAHVQVGDPIEFSNHPYLPDAVWNPPGSKKGGAGDDVQAGLSYEAAFDS
jgi:hypothetical protein